MDNHNHKDEFYTKQILTYMGNKRKFITIIQSIINDIKKDLGKGREITIGEGFSGSGILSRLFKNNSNTIYVNDIAGYSNTINKCYLSTLNKSQIKIIHSFIDKANLFVKQIIDNNGYDTISKTHIPKFIQKYWAPKSDHIQENERVYFTSLNGKLIDAYMYFILKYVPNNIRHYLLAPLLVQCSIHNNTSGHFSAFYKDKQGIGSYGGSKNIDLNRITKPITIPYPILSNHKCNVNITQMDTNDWVKNIPELDLVYYDPPYNKHPYCIYYFLLDIINNWDTTITIPETNRGQPKNWNQSKYCSIKYATKTFQELIKNTSAKYILLSYNDGGIISLQKIQEILTKYGKVSTIPVDHKTYNKMKGIANYKRKNENVQVKEFLWLLKKS